MLAVLFLFSPDMTAIVYNQSLADDRYQAIVQGVGKSQDPRERAWRISIITIIIMIMDFFGVVLYHSYSSSAPCSLLLPCRQLPQPNSAKLHFPHVAFLPTEMEPKNLSQRETGSKQANRERQPQ